MCVCVCVWLFTRIGSGIFFSLLLLSYLVLRLLHRCSPFMRVSHIMERAFAIHRFFVCVMFMSHIIRASYTLFYCVSHTTSHTQHTCVVYRSSTCITFYKFEYEIIIVLYIFYIWKSILSLGCGWAPSCLAGYSAVWLFHLFDLEYPLGARARIAFKVWSC